MLSSMRCYFYFCGGGRLGALVAPPFRREFFYVVATEGLGDVVVVVPLFLTGVRCGPCGHVEGFESVFEGFIGRGGGGGAVPRGGDVMLAIAVVIVAAAVAALMLSSFIGLRDTCASTSSPRYCARRFRISINFPARPNTSSAPFCRVFQHHIFAAPLLVFFFRNLCFVRIALFQTHDRGNSFYSFFIEQRYVPSRSRSTLILSDLDPHAGGMSSDLGCTGEESDASLTLTLTLTVNEGRHILVYTLGLEKTLRRATLTGVPTRRPLPRLFVRHPPSADDLPDPILELFAAAGGEHQ